MQIKRLLLVLLLCVAGLPCALQAGQLAVIADNANPTTNLTATDLMKIFTAHSRIWPNGKPIIVVMRDPSSTDMQLVLRKLLNMTSEQAHAFIQVHHDAIVVAASDDAILQFVSASQGAIGVVDLYSLTQDVKVVKVDGKLPVEQGYLLRGN